MRTFSKEAMERPLRTIEAAGTLRENAWEIGRATAEAMSDEIVVALVQKDMTFGGVWTIERKNLLDQVPRMEEEGGWPLLFSANTTPAQIAERCLSLARIAFRRWEIMQRWAARHAQPPYE